MIQTLMQDITYLTIRCMCSHNENMTGIVSLVAAFTKGRYRMVVMMVIVDSGDGSGVVGGGSNSSEVVGSSGDSSEIVSGMH